jgi:predicted nucleotidyltransferase
MTMKPVRRAEQIEVVYNSDHWKLLSMLRAKAVKVMKALEQGNDQSIVHGSIARGDVSTRSDIDVFIPEPPSPFAIETCLERAGLSINKRLLV